MAKLDCELAVADVLKTVYVDVRITGVGKFRARAWLASIIMRLAAKVLGAGRINVKWGYRRGTI